MYIIKSIKDFIKTKSTIFTTPGHSQGFGLSAEIINLLGRKSFQADLSEVAGLDNLQNPSGAILKSQTKASEIYRSKHSYYLINGSSSGIIALMLAVTKPGDQILLARNAHKSVINALVLTGAVPVWINTEWLNDWNIPAQICPKKIEESLNNNPQIKSVWITNPTYEGIVSDIYTIAKICKEKNVLLIVDEAHGALWNFSNKLPNPAIQLGADASIQSLHKTASSLTQGAILHLGHTSKINPEKLQNCLNIINTTSPSYLILASIESTIKYLNSNKGQKYLNTYLNNIDNFYKKLSIHSDISFLPASKEYNIDKTKITLGINGIYGHILADILEKKHNIEIELDNNKGVLALTGIGTSKNKINKLFKAITKIKNNINTLNDGENASCTPLINPEIVFSPGEAFYKDARKINIKDSIGLVSQETIVAYPPGIPVITAGEIIKQEHLHFLKNQTQIAVITD